MPPDEKSVKAFTSVPIFNVTISCQIKILLASIEMRSYLQNCTFPLQMNEFMNMVGLAHLFVLIWHGHQLSSQEDLVLYECLAPSISSAEIFKVLKKYSKC